MAFVMNQLLLVLTCLFCSQALFFGVFEDPTSVSEPNEQDTQERLALSWLTNQLFGPRHSESNLPGDSCSGVPCKLPVNLSQPITLDALVEAWHNNPAHDWSNSEVINWLDGAHKRPQIREVFANNRIDGTKLASLLTIDANASSLSESHLTTDDLLWLKERIAAIILFGPPSPIDFNAVISTGAAWTFATLLVATWFVWHQLIRPRAASLRILMAINRSRYSISRLRIRLNTIRQSLSHTTCVNTSLSTPERSDICKLATTSHECFIDEITFAEAALEFSEFFLDEMEFETIRHPRLCATGRTVEHLDRIMSFTNVLRLRVNAMKSQLVVFRTLQDRLCTSSLSGIKTELSAPSLVSSAPISDTICLATYDCNETKTTDPSVGGENSNEQPVAEVTRRCSSFTQTDHVSANQCADAEELCSPKPSDLGPNEVTGSDTYSNESPNENLPHDQLESDLQMSAKLTTSKIPLPFRVAPPHALTPLFSVMNPSTHTWDVEQSTPSHIPLGSRNSVPIGRTPYPSRLVAPRCRAPLIASSHTSDALQHQRHSDI